MDIIPGQRVRAFVKCVKLTRRCYKPLRLFWPRSLSKFSALQSAACYIAQWQNILYLLKGVLFHIMVRCLSTNTYHKCSTQYILRNQGRRDNVRRWRHGKRVAATPNPRFSPQAQAIQHGLDRNLSLMIVYIKLLLEPSTSPVPQVHVFACLILLSTFLVLSHFNTISGGGSNQQPRCRLPISMLLRRSPLQVAHYSVSMSLHYLPCMHNTSRCLLRSRFLPKLTDWFILQYRYFPIQMLFQ